MSLLSSAKEFSSDNKGLLQKVSDSAYEAPKESVAAPTLATRATSPDLGAMAAQMMARADRGFYGHMTIERCKQMSNCTSTLRSDKSGFAKTQTNGLSGKKGK